MPTEPRKIRVGRAIGGAARATGMPRILGVRGAKIYPLFEGLYGRGVELIVPRHEQAAGYMAMGYAKSTGRTGVFTVVPGPGVLNAGAALCTAMGNCAPVVCLTGQVPSSYLGRGRGHLHELADQRGSLKPFIKDAWRIDAPADVVPTVNRAFRAAQSGRPGPVAVETCWDTLAAAAPPVLAPPEVAHREPEPDTDAIGAAAKLLAAARKPMLMCGAGAQHAATEVLALAETLQAPVTAFRSGRGVVPEDHALGVAAVAARELWDEVDVLVGIGSRLEMPYMRWRDMLHNEPRPSRPKLIRIDINANELRRFPADVGFMFGLQELATAAQYRIALVTVVFNNRAYGNVLRDQETQFGGRTIGARLDNPDFVRLAEAFGVRGRRVADPAALRSALAEELAAGQPALIEVTIAPGTETS